MPRPTLLAHLTRRVETATLLIILIIAGALWAFVTLVARIMTGDPYTFDAAILQALRSPGDPASPIGGPRILEAMRDITALGSTAVLALGSLALLAFLVLRRQPASAFFLATALIGGQALGHLAKTAVARPRPEVVPHLVEALSASFPSGHSMMAAVIYLTLAVMLARTEPRFRIRAFYITIATLLSLLVGISRLFLGVHWPTDVLAGWVLGAAWALGVWLVARGMARHRQVAPALRAEP